MSQHAQMGGGPDVIQAITEKLIRRHPHVFGDSGTRSRRRRKPRVRKRARTLETALPPDATVRSRESRRGCRHSYGR
jgi:hypothetical protein